MIKKVRKFKFKPTQIMVIGFALIIIIGTILLSLPVSSSDGKSVGIIDAFFTSTSAVCVTGLVVLDTALEWSIFGKIIILLLIQIGGLGFMTIGTLFALAIGKKITFRERTIMQESLNQNQLSGIVRLTKRIIYLTFAIEMLGAFFLSFRFIPMLGFGKGIFYSIFHSVTAFCNAGFDLMGSITGPFSSFTSFSNDILVNLTIIALIIIGGLGFAVVIEVIQVRKFGKLSLHSKVVLKMTGLLIIIGFTGTLLFEYTNSLTLGNLNFQDKILPSLFHSVTTRTAGFNTIDISKLTNSLMFLTVILMFIGGSSGSTAGGVKITTVAVFAGLIRTVLRGDNETEIFKRKIPIDIVRKSVAIIGLATSLVILITMVLTITEPTLQFKEILFEVVSAFGTVGLSLGITPVLSPIGRILISLTMFFGRVGPLTILLAISYNKTLMRVRYPEGEIIVG